MIEAGKKAFQRIRKEVRGAEQLIQQAMPDQQEPGRLVSKVVKFFRNWQLNIGEDDVVYADCGQKTTVWHRDVVAAKCILYKGMHCNVVMNDFMHFF